MSRPKGSKMPRGICAGCRKLYALQLDGKVRLHAHPTELRACDGAWNVPADVALEAK